MIDIVKKFSEAALMALIAASICATFIAQGQTIGNQSAIVGGNTLGPLNFPRNIQITTTNDSVALVVSKPAPSGGLTNDYLDFFTGGTLAFNVNSNGAVGIPNTNAIAQTQGNLGLLVFSNGTVTATEDITNTFATPFIVPPVVVLGHNNDSNYVLSVTTTNFVITNNAGTQPITSFVIGLP